MQPINQSGVRLHPNRLIIPSPQFHSVKITMYGPVPSRIHPIGRVTKTITVMLLTSNFIFHS